MGFHIVQLNYIHPIAQDHIRCGIGKNLSGLITRTLGGLTPKKQYTGQSGGVGYNDLCFQRNLYSKRREYNLNP